MDTTCELVVLHAQPTLVVRTRSSVEQLPGVLGPAWGAVMACAGKVGAQPTDPPFVAYHNADLQDLDVEIGMAFAQVLPGEGDVHAHAIPASRAVACVHVGRPGPHALDSRSPLLRCAQAAALWVRTPELRT